MGADVAQILVTVAIDERSEGHFLHDGVLWCELRRALSNANLCVTRHLFNLRGARVRSNGFVNRRSRVQIPKMAPIPARPAS